MTGWPHQYSTLIWGECSRWSISIAHVAMGWGQCDLCEWAAYFKLFGREIIFEVPIPTCVITVSKRHGPRTDGRTDRRHTGIAVQQYWNRCQLLLVCKRVSWSGRLSHVTPAVKGHAHCWIFAEEPKNRSCYTPIIQFSSISLNGIVSDLALLFRFR